MDTAISAAMSVYWTFDEEVKYNWSIMSCGGMSEKLPVSTIEGWQQQRHSNRDSVGGNIESDEKLVCEDYDDSSRSRITRMVLIGRTGAGKSATGNTILGQSLLESKASGQSVTHRCRHETADRFGRHLQLVDTPGLFDTGLTTSQVQKEIIKCIALTSPGPHAFILVTAIGRFTEEERKTVEYLREIFGDTVLKFMIILFSKSDELDNDGMDIHDYVRDVPHELEDILSLCNYRYVSINNRGSQNEKDADTLELFRQIDTMIEENGCSYYTNKTFKIAEQQIGLRKMELQTQLTDQQTHDEMDLTKQSENEIKKSIELYESRQKEFEIEMRRCLDVPHSETMEQVRTKKSVHRLFTEIEQLKQRQHDEISARKNEKRKALTHINKKYIEKGRNIGRTIRKETEDESHGVETLLTTLWQAMFKNVLTKNPIMNQLSNLF